MFAVSHSHSFPSFCYSSRTCTRTCKLIIWAGILLSYHRVSAPAHRYPCLIDAATSYRSTASFVEQQGQRYPSAPSALWVFISSSRSSPCCLSTSLWTIISTLVTRPCMRLLVGHIAYLFGGGLVIMAPRAFVSAPGGHVNRRIIWDFCDLGCKPTMVPKFYVSKDGIGDHLPRLS